MPEISEQVSEALEHAEGHGDHGSSEKKKSNLNSIVAASVAVAATFMAVGNVKAGNVVQAMGKVQIEIVDTWSFFQAKSTKQSLAEAALEQLTLQKETAQLTPTQTEQVGKQLESYREKVARYEKEKNELKSKVEQLEKSYEALNVKDDQFDISESLLSVGIAMFGITALTQKRALIFVAAGFAIFGVIMSLAGFLGWNIRPEWLAKIIGA